MMTHRNAVDIMQTTKAIGLSKASQYCEKPFWCAQLTDVLEPQFATTIHSTLKDKVGAVKMGGRPNSQRETSTSYRTRSWRKMPCSCKYAYGGFHDGQLDTYSDKGNADVVGGTLAFVGRQINELIAPTRTASGISQQLPELDYIVANLYMGSHQHIGPHNDSDPLWGGTDGECVIVTYTVNFPGIFVFHAPDGTAAYNYMWDKGHLAKTRKYNTETVAFVFCPPNSMLVMGGHFQSQCKHLTFPHEDMFRDAPKNYSYLCGLSRESWEPAFQEYRTWCIKRGIDEQKFQDRLVLTCRGIMNHQESCVLSNSKMTFAEKFHQFEKVQYAPSVTSVSSGTNYYHATSKARPGSPWQMRELRKAGVQYDGATSATPLDMRDADSTVEPTGPNTRDETTARIDKLEELIATQKADLQRLEAELLDKKAEVEAHKKARTETKEELAAYQRAENQDVAFQTKMNAAHANNCSRALRLTDQTTAELLGDVQQNRKELQEWQPRAPNAAIDHWKDLLWDVFSTLEGWLMFKRDAIGSARLMKYIHRSTLHEDAKVRLIRLSGWVAGFQVSGFTIESSRPLESFEVALGLFVSPCPSLTFWQSCR